MSLHLNHNVKEPTKTDALSYPIFRGATWRLISDAPSEQSKWPAPSVEWLLCPTHPTVKHYFAILFPPPKNDGISVAYTSIGTLDAPCQPLQTRRIAESTR